MIVELKFFVTFYGAHYLWRDLFCRKDTAFKMQRCRLIKILN